MFSEKEWREIYKKAGGIAVCADPTWLLNGCPRCGNKTWEVTNDCYANCKKCLKGIPTDFPFTKPGEIISDLTTKRGSK